SAAVLQLVIRSATATSTSFISPSPLFITSAAVSGVSLSQPANVGHLSLATGAASGTTSWIRTGTSLPASPQIRCVAGTVTTSRRYSSYRTQEFHLRTTRGGDHQMQTHMRSSDKSN